MCGIVGYTGQRPAEPILVSGLRRLEYRGYDSSGLATVSGGRLSINLDTGRATIDGSGVSGGGQGGPGAVQNQGGRVTGRFSVPERSGGSAPAPKQ